MVPVTIDQILADYEIEFSPEYSARCGYAEYPDTSLFCDEFAALCASARRLRHRLLAMAKLGIEVTESLTKVMARQVELLETPR